MSNGLPTAQFLLQKTDGADSVDVSKNLANHTKIVTDVIMLNKQSNE